MKVITAPTYYVRQESDICVFLAGGITKCSNWQKEVIDYLEKEHKSNLDDLVICNPRRDNFPIDDLSAAAAQINWEFDMLEHCDIFSIYFDKSESDQPICMYELGRNICRMQMRFPTDWENRIIVSSDVNYRRYNDVILQKTLATNDSYVNTSLFHHCKSIYESYIDVLRKK